MLLPRPLNTQARACCWGHGQGAQGQLGMHAYGNGHCVYLPHCKRRLPPPTAGHALTHHAPCSLLCSSVAHRRRLPALLPKTSSAGLGQVGTCRAAQLRHLTASTLCPASAVRKACRQLALASKTYDACRPRQGCVHSRPYKFTDVPCGITTKTLLVLSGLPIQTGHSNSWTEYHHTTEIERCYSLTEAPPLDPAVSSPLSPSYLVDTLTQPIIVISTQPYHLPLSLTDCVASLMWHSPSCMIEKPVDRRTCQPLQRRLVCQFITILFQPVD